MIRNPLELGGKTVHVQKNSAYVSRLRNLMEEIGDTIIIKEAIRSMNCSLRWWPGRN
jgi:membrane-bound lytic murein transglycosylase F